MYKTILQANDGSAGADKALVAALDLAKLSGAELHMICVEEISEFPEIIGEVREEKRFADRRYRPIVQHAERLAEERRQARYPYRHGPPGARHRHTGRRSCRRPARDRRHGPFHLLRARSRHARRPSGRPLALPRSGGKVSAHVVTVSPHGESS